MRLDRLEESVLRGLQERLLTPELTDVFVREFTAEINRQKAEASSVHTETDRKLIATVKQITNIVDAVAAGRSSEALLDRLAALELDKSKLESNLSGPIPDPVRIHPNVAEHYIEKVANLRDSLNKEDSRDQAAEILRSLVDEIRLHPIDGELQIELVGDLASLISFGDQYDAANKKPGSVTDSGRTKWLVAGVGFEPTTFRL